jgi:hypothetical protein
MKLTDDWQLKNQSQERCNYQLALYATHLATGSNLHCRSLKSGTIQTYLRDVAKFIGRYRDIDPRYRSSADKALAPAISRVLDEVKRWETVPNRREPFTLEMQFHIAKQAESKKDDCCLEAAVANWTLCNMYAGCRGIEWMQTNSNNSQLHSFHKNRFGNAYAFTLADVQCKNSTNQIMSIAEALANPDIVGSVNLRFEEQKNSENGEKKLFVRNTDKPHICFIKNFVQIIQRHAKLTDSNPTIPLSVYRHTNGSVCNITSIDVETLMRQAASELFNLHPIKNKAELQMWSSHSLRVGACTTLYAMGFQEMEIKHLLRWKSDAFMTYLRNLAVTSRRHNTALSDASCIPNFL